MPFDAIVEVFGGAYVIAPIFQALQYVAIRREALLC